MRKFPLLVCLTFAVNLTVNSIELHSSRIAYIQTTGRFINEQRLKANLVQQAQGAPEILAQLRKMGVTSDKNLRVLFYFYTNSDSKAKVFDSKLIKLGYTAKPRPAATIKDQYVVTGWTTKIKMDSDAVIAWAKKMCELGYKFDCDFDGWETSPDAPENK